LRKTISDFTAWTGTVVSDHAVDGLRQGGHHSCIAGAHRTHSWLMPPSFCGAGATCGVAAGGDGLACAGGSTTCDGGALRWRAGATCGRRVTLPEVRILRFAICHELQIELWHRFARPARLRRSPHDGRDAIHEKADAGPGAALHKSRLLASCLDFGAGPLAWGRLNSASQTDD
jgi:hypothetical protein